MSTRQRSRTKAAPPRAPLPHTTPRGAAPRPRTVGGSKWLFGGLIAAIVVCGIGGALWQLHTATAAPTPFAVGTVDSCRKLPHFAASVGLRGTLSISTSDPHRRGLVLIGTGGGYQGKTWDDAGTLGPFAVDRDGNIYTAPAPHVSFTDTITGSERTIYRVDTTTGVMAPFIVVPPAAPSDPTNRFGILGLTYDCDTHSLYATIVAGSTRHQEVGQIVRIDLATHQVLPQIVGFDALGLGIVNSNAGKRLFFGSARQSDVYVATLDAHGNVTGPPQLAFSFGDHDHYGSARVRRFAFPDATTITLTTVPFAFNLRPGSDQLAQTLRYRSNATTNTWTFETTQLP